MMAPGFRPAWWLPGAHAQTLWGTFFRRPPAITTHMERWPTPDGDFLEVDRLAIGPAASAARAPRLIILHGLEGSARSHYVRGLLAQAARRGWAADAIVFRSCGTELNRTARFYHSGETTDLAFVVDRVMRETPQRPLVLAGVSLGGNVLLKWLGEAEDRIPAAVRAAAAISVPYDLARSADHIDRGFARRYQTHFLRSLRRKAIAKHAVVPGRYDVEAVRCARSLREFDDRVTAPVHGFRNAAEYYARSSALRWLSRIHLPTLLLAARDDPFLPEPVLDEVAEAARDNPALTAEFVAYGGHAGFVAGASPFRPRYWAEERAMEFLARHAARSARAPLAGRGALSRQTARDSFSP